MRPQHLVPLLALPAVLLATLLAVFLTLAGPAAPAHASGIVSVCDEAHLRAALAGGGTVTFSCSGTITLTAEIVIAADTTIDGSGQTVTISGNHAVRVFTVNSGAPLNLNALTVADGSTTGSGGGIENYGALTISNSAFTNNHADFEGGGIYNENGAVTVNSSSFSDNSTRLTGGGIYNHRGASSSMNGTTFSRNNANSGGGIGNYGTITVSDSTFAINYAYSGSGGIANGGTLTVSNSVFADNRAHTFGGGIGNFGTAILINSTFSGNRAYSFGGGIYGSGTLTVSNNTFTDNDAPQGGGICFYPDGTATLRNTIIANSPTGGNCSGTITDGGGNLSYPDATCPGINGDPVLGPLQDNGGPTWTMALLPGSAALDAADDAICAAPPVNNLDQRGVARPQGPHCDIGAYEAKPPPIFLPIIMR